MICWSSAAIVWMMFRTTRTSANVAPRLFATRRAASAKPFFHSTSSMSSWAGRGGPAQRVSPKGSTTAAVPPQSRTNWRRVMFMVSSLWAGAPVARPSGEDRAKWDSS